MITPIQQATQDLRAANDDGSLETAVFDIEETVKVVADRLAQLVTLQIQFNRNFELWQMDMLEVTAERRDVSAPEQVLQQDDTNSGKGFRPPLLAAALLGISGAVTGFIEGVIQGLVRITRLVEFVFNNGRISKALDTMSNTFARGLEDTIRVIRVSLRKALRGAHAKTGVIGKTILSLFDGLTTGIQGIVNTIKGHFGWLTKGTDAFRGLLTWGDNVVDAFDFIIDGLHRFFSASKAVGRVIGKLAYPIAVIMSIWDGVVGGLEGFKRDGSLTQKIIHSALGAIGGVLKGLIALPLDMLKAGLSWITGKFGADKLVDALESFSFEEMFDKVLDVMHQFVNNPIEMFLDFGRKQLERIRNTDYSELIATLTDSVTTTLLDVLTFVPRKIIEFANDLGKRVLDFDLLQGIDLDEVYDAFKNWVLNMKNKLLGWIPGIGDKTLDETLDESIRQQNKRQVRLAREQGIVESGRFGRELTVDRSRVSELSLTQLKALVADSRVATESKEILRKQIDHIVNNRISTTARSSNDMTSTTARSSNDMTSTTARSSNDMTSTTSSSSNDMTSTTSSSSNDMTSTTARSVAIIDMTVPMSTQQVDTALRRLDRNEITLHDQIVENRTLAFASKDRDVKEALDTKYSSLVQNLQRTITIRNQLLGVDQPQQLAEKSVTQIITGISNDVQQQITKGASTSLSTVDNKAVKISATSTTMDATSRMSSRSETMEIMRIANMAKAPTIVAPSQTSNTTVSNTTIQGAGPLMATDRMDEYRGLFGG